MDLKVLSRQISHDAAEKFAELTEAIAQRLREKHGMKIFVFIDDFALMADSREELLEHMRIFEQHVAEELGVQLPAPDTCARALRSTPRSQGSADVALSPWTQCASEAPRLAASAGHAACTRRAEHPQRTCARTERRHLPRKSACGGFALC
mgnify:CR=1 FL=1